MGLLFFSFIKCKNLLDYCVRGQILSQLSVKDEPLWASANARMKLDQQVVKVHLTLPLSNEPLQLWKHDIVNRATAPDFV